MTTMIFSYVGPISGLERALAEAIKQQEMVFDTEGGDKPEAAIDFLRLLPYLRTGQDVEIRVGNLVLKAYDHAALMNGLYEAVEYYIDEVK